MLQLDGNGILKDVQLDVHGLTKISDKGTVFDQEKFYHTSSWFTVVFVALVEKTC